MSNAKPAGPLSGWSNTRVVFALATLLIVQIGVAGLLQLTANNYREFKSSAPFMSCDVNRAVKIEVQDATEEGKPKTSLTLKKNGTVWEIPDYASFKVSEYVIEDVIGGLKDLKKGLPVGTTKDALERFKVAPSNYRRALTVTDDQQKSSTIYLGTSPAYRFVYARPQDGNEVYSIEFPEYQVTAKASDWMDKNALDFNQRDIKILELNVQGAVPVKLEQEADGKKWTLTPANKNADTAKVTSALTSIGHLNLSSYLSLKPDGSFDVDRPYFSCNVTLKNGNNFTYSFYKQSSKSGTGYVLKRSDKPWYVGVDEWSFKDLKDLLPETSSTKTEPAAANK